MYCDLVYNYYYYLISQNITFDDSYARALLALEEVEEGGADPAINYDDDEPTDNSPWAGTDRDYSYEEVW